MGATKTAVYTPSQLNSSKICKSLAHPARFKMAEVLLDGKSMTNKEFSKILKFNTKTTKEHLDQMKNAGIITTQYEIHKHLIRLNPEHISIVSAIMNHCQI